MRQSLRERCQRHALLFSALFSLAIFSPATLHAQNSSPFKNVMLVQDPPAAFHLQMPSPYAFSPTDASLAPTESSSRFVESSPFGSDALLQARAVPPQRDVSWKSLPRNFLEDQKDMWFTFPNHLFHGQHWLPTFSIIAVGGGLIEADPYDTPYFRQTHRFDDFNEYFSKVNTDAFLAIGPATVYLVGLWRKDTFAQKTSLFAGEAAADGMVFYAIAQEATHRSRPIEISPHGEFGDTFYDGHHGILSNSFPSGHAIEAFAIATVFERRYRDHKWVPWIAYGVATVIGFSRITLQSHFPSDVFIGSAIGYTVGRYVALQGQ